MSRTLAASLLTVGFDGLQATPHVRALLEAGCRSVILFTRNYQSPAQLKELTDELRHAAAAPLLISVDHEGGRVQRFREGFTAIPSMRDIATSGDDAVVEAGRAMARELRTAGVNWNLSPVLDVDSNPANPVIGARSFSSDPTVVGRLGAAMISALQAGGVAACGKHFPGHGDTSIDSHFDLPSVPHDRQRLNTIELPPFIDAIRAGVASIMVGHLVVEAIDPSMPALMSRRLVNDLLRNELGYRGVVTTDDLEMKAIADRFPIGEVVVRSVQAGIDLCMICHTPELQTEALDALAQAIESGIINSDTVIAAAERLDRLARRYAVTV
jgi:beta-N-acetylhexosaminidase